MLYRKTHWLQEFFEDERTISAVSLIIFIHWIPYLIVVLRWLFHYSISIFLIMLQGSPPGAPSKVGPSWALPPVGGPEYKDIRTFRVSRLTIPCLIFYQSYQKSHKVVYLAVVSFYSSFLLMIYQTLSSTIVSLCRWY